MNVEEAKKIIADGIQAALTNEAGFRVTQAAAHRIAETLADANRNEPIFSNVRGAGVIGFRRDRRARVWLQMTDGSERRGKRFMSLRVAKKWGQRQVGKIFVDFHVTPIAPIEYIMINASLDQFGQNGAQS